MISLRRITKDYDEVGALQSLVAVQSLVADGVWATKTGDLLMILAVQGVDYECLDASQVDAMARRFEAAIRTLDERFRLYQYLVKRKQPPPPGDPCTHPVVREAITNRVRYLQEEAGALFVLETYFVIVYEGARPRRDSRATWRRWLAAPRAALRDTFSQTAATQTLERDMAAACDLLRDKVANLEVQLRDVLPISILDATHGFTFFRRLLNDGSEKADVVPLKYGSFVDFQACSSALECHSDYLRLGEDYIQVLTLKEPPARTFANLLRDLSELACNAIIVSEWKRVDPLQTRRVIQSKRRHFHNVKVSAASYLNTGKTNTASDSLVDEGAVALVGDLGACLQEIDLHGRHFGEFSLTVVLSDQDLAVLRHAAAQCFKVFAIHDAHLIEERYNRLNAWLAVQPGNAPYNLRRLWLLNNNFADLSFLYTLRRGEARNTHLDTDYLALFEGTGGVPYYFNLHYKDVAHTLLLGATGSGKSFTLNFILTHLQKYGTITTIFDLGSSYESLTRLFGGSYFPVSAAKRDFTINPFCLPPTAENLLFLFAFVKVLAESTSFRLSAEDEKDLFEQIENLYTISPDQRRLFTLANIVRRPVRTQLQKWVQGGAYAGLFDNAEDTLTLARFQTFDFEGMAQADQVEPLLFYVLHRAYAAITASQEAMIFKVFVMDEAWRFLRHPVIRAYVVEALKTWRKKSAAILLATQSSEDLISSELLPTVVESCPTKIFLANPGMDRAAYRRAFHLNETEAEKIAGLIPKEEILIKQPEFSKLVRLRVDRKGYWLYTNSPQDNQRKREAFARFGFEEGLEQLAKTRHP